MAAHEWFGEFDDDTEADDAISDAGVLALETEVTTRSGGGPIVWSGPSKRNRRWRYGVRINGAVEFFDAGEVRSAMKDSRMQKTDEEIMTEIAAALGEERGYIVPAPTIRAVIRDGYPRLAAWTKAIGSRSEEHRDSLLKDMAYDLRRAHLEMQKLAAERDAALARYAALCIGDPYSGDAWVAPAPAGVTLALRDERDGAIQNLAAIRTVHATECHADSGCRTCDTIDATLPPAWQWPATKEAVESAPNVDLAFYKLTVAQRDSAWAEIERLRATIESQGAEIAAMHSDPLRSQARSEMLAAVARLADTFGVDLRLREALDEIELLRAERDGARMDIFEVIARIVEHNHKNVSGLAHFDLDEARCRKLATLYLEEAVNVVRLDDDLRRIRANSKRMDEILEQARALVAETE